MADVSGAQLAARACKEVTRAMNFTIAVLKKCVRAAANSIFVLKKA